MELTRREFGVGAAALSLWAASPATARAEGGKRMFGLIGQMLAVPGSRDELAGILAEATTDMPGCLAYVVAKDSENGDALWITEVWTDRQSHEASLQLPQVRSAIARGRPLIAGFGPRIETVPIAGISVDEGRCR